eukprot:NODE_1229_length_1203_cov_311.866725.p7 GENE.NODE_1229_length_1203_cov_311.866725~~NODE_1229_length_1203_cov_311.866725.p7  ORF type:complete len:66 (+),score=9.11 NODE_1229_length_1203_cov_311.866725:528-725(+)
MEWAVWVVEGRQRCRPSSVPFLLEHSTACSATLSAYSARRSTLDHHATLLELLSTCSARRDDRGC